MYKQVSNLDISKARLRLRCNSDILDYMVYETTGVAKVEVENILAELNEEPVKNSDLDRTVIIEDEENFIAQNNS